MTAYINAALAGTVKQSPTETDGDATNAIDGNTDGNFSNGSVASTFRSFQPFWEVDLGEIRDIRQIVIHPRTDCCTEDLKEFYVLISDIPFVRFASEIRPDEGGLATRDDRLAQPGVSNRYVANSSPLTRIDFARSGRYIRVQKKQDYGTLDLAEVQVMVEADSSVGACGSPGVDFRTEGGLHLWKACDGPWNLMLSGDPGDGTVTAAGTLSANFGFTDVTGQSLEGADTVTNTDPQRIGFDLSTGSPWMDRFQFTKSGDDALCIALDSNSTGQPLLIGPTRAPAGNGPINPQTMQSCVLSRDECRKPDFDPRTDRALLTWIDCDGNLRIIGSGGLQDARYAGHVYTSSSTNLYSNITNLLTRSFESSDMLFEIGGSNFSPTHHGIFFNMSMGGGYADEILLRTPVNAEICVDIAVQSADTLLLAGADRTPITSPFNPRTLEPCQRPPESFRCGDPQINSNEDSALFIWMNCNGTWSARLTGQRPDGGSVNVQGSFHSGSGYGALRRRGIESSDSVTQLPGQPVEFNMTTISPWSDGFDVDLPAGSRLCVSLQNVSAGLQVLLGPDRNPRQFFSTSFDPIGNRQRGCF